MKLLSKVGELSGSGNTAQMGKQQSSLCGSTMASVSADPFTRGGLTETEARGRAVPREC